MFSLWKGHLASNACTHSLDLVYEIVKRPPCQVQPPNVLIADFVAIAKEHGFKLGQDIVIAETKLAKAITVSTDDRPAPGRLPTFVP